MPRRAPLGFPLPEAWTQNDPFTAVALFVLESDELFADPFGFAQISWGLWNSSTTGLERTGNLASLAGDTFELIEFDYFPNVSPEFGGPFLSPSVFGLADVDNPLFGLLGSFTNLAFASVEVELPLDTPLLAVLQHRPGEDAVVVSLHHLMNFKLLPVSGAVAVAPLSQLGLREYAVDTLGLTLWLDGYGGAASALHARVVYHGLAAAPGLIDRPERLLKGRHGRRPSPERDSEDR